MIGALKNKIAILRYKGCITEDEYLDFIKKIDANDREIYEKAYAEGKNSRLIAEIKIDVGMMKEMIDEKIKEFEVDIQTTRNKAIDEFTEKLIQTIHNVPSKVIGGGNVLKIAEQMKGGADNV